MSLKTVTAGAPRFVLLLFLSPPGNVHSLSQGTFAREIALREIGSQDAFDCGATLLPMIPEQSSWT